jgi:hypothetical protein
MRFSAAIVHLPDVKNSGGWTSSIVIRNNAAAQASVAVNYYNTSGGWVSSQTATIASNGSATLTPSSGFAGSAVVVASQDVAVVVVNDSGSKAYAYEGIPAAPSFSGIGVGTAVFLPVHCRNYYGWSSTLYVQNTGGAATTIHAYLYNGSGTQVGHQWTASPVNPNGQAVFSSLGGAAMGSVRVTADQPVAVVVRHTNASMDDQAYAGVSSPGTAAYLPALFRNYYGWWSSYYIQEALGLRAQGNVVYYPSGSGPAFDLTGGVLEVWMGGQQWDGWHGSARVAVTGGNGGQVVTAMQHASSFSAMAYTGFRAGARDLRLPLLKKNVDGWNASLTVQNVGAANAQVTLHFYNTGGTEISPYGPFTLQAGYSRELYTELPSGFNGSVWVHSEGADVVAVVHEAHTNGRELGYGAVR